MSLKDTLVVGKKLAFASSYNETADLVSFLRTSYHSNGTDYTQGYAPDGRIIHRNECEENKDYETRCKQTPTRSYVSSIINKYSASVFRNEPTRQIDSATYELLYSDADGYGTNLNSLMKSALLRAQIDGRCFLLADSTDLNTEILTIAQKQSSGARPYIRKLSVEHIVDYTEVEESILDAIILLEDEYGVTFARYMDGEVFIDIKLTDKYVITEVGEEYQHGYSSVPLVEIEPYDDSAQAKPLAYSQRVICNILSKLGQELEDSVFTKFILSGTRIPQGDDAQQQKITWSGKRLVVLEDATAKLDFVGADHGSADSLRKQIELEEGSLYYSAGFGKSNVADQATNVSGYSLEIQREDFYIVCNNLKTSIESAENKVMSLIAEKEGFDYTEAVYSSRFAADDSGSELSKLRDSLSLPLPNAFKKLLIKEYIHRFYNVSEEDMRQIELELTSNIAEA